MKAVEGTEAGQAISDNMDKLNAFLGQKVAEIIEGVNLNPEYESEKYLIGGGDLLSSILTGAMPGGPKKKGGTVVTVKDRPSGHFNDKKDDQTVLGGAHRDTSKPVNDKLDSHHCPAQSCYKGAPISTKDGPAIKMDPADHEKTASYGGSKQAEAYRAKQEELLSQGKLKEAMQMDIDDIRRKFDNKYEEGIKQMLEYASKLDPNDFKR